jgi:hypothetical protein
MLAVAFVAGQLRRHLPADAGALVAVQLSRRRGLSRNGASSGSWKPDQQLFFITPNSVLGAASHAATRGLHPFAGARVGSHSFLFFNVFQLLFMFGKTAAVCWLVLQFLPAGGYWRSPRARCFSLYPADWAQFTFPRVFTSR